MTFCPSCGDRLTPGGRFCGQCGAGTSAVTVAAPTDGLAEARAAVPGPRGAAAGEPLGSDRAGASALPYVAAPTVRPAHAASTQVPPAVGAGRPGVLDGVLAELGRLPVRELLPLQDWWRSSEWRQGRSALFLLTALTPFLLLQATSEDTGVERTAVGFAVYFAFLWLVAIRALVQPEPLSWTVLAKIVAFTTFAGAAIAIAIEEQLGASTDTLHASILTVGLPEEAAKALPVLVFLRAGVGRWTPRTYAYAGAVSGLAFGAAEAVTYTTAYAAFLDLEGGGLVVSLWRLLAGSLFHACMAGIVAFFIGLGAWYVDVRWHLLAFGLLVAGVLHGVYNYLSDGWGGTLLAALIVFTFVGYVRTGDQIGGRLKEHLPA